MEWTKDQVEKLVQEYQRWRLLWDPCDPHHRQGMARYDAWSQIARALDCSVPEMRKKLISVFASYRREKSNVRNGKPSYWFLYDQLSFMPHYLPNIKSATDTNQRSDSSQRKIRKKEKSSSESENDNDDGMLQPEMEVKLEMVVVPGEEKPVIHTRRRLTRGGGEVSQVQLREQKRKIHCKRKLTRRGESSPVRAVRGERGEKVKRDGKDECDSFGEYIAMSLRKHDQRTRATMKQAINNIIYELEMKKYCPTLILDSTSTNPLHDCT